jgi:hypothetical protein
MRRTIGGRVQSVVGYFLDGNKVSTEAEEYPELEANTRE